MSLTEITSRRKWWPLLMPYRWRKDECAIYLIRNSANDKIYIGITKKPAAQRRAQHFSDAKAGRKTKICRAIRKYGRESFEFYVLGIYKRYEHVLSREVRWIAALKPEYNTTAGGEGGPTMLGRKHSEESKAKMRAAKLANPNRYWLGKKRPPETVAKMRAANLGKTGYWTGKKRSAETIRKILETKAARKVID